MCASLIGMPLYAELSEDAIKSRIVGGTTGFAISCVTHTFLRALTHKVRNELSPDTYERLLAYTQSEHTENILFTLLGAGSEVASNHVLQIAANRLRFSNDNEIQAEFTTASEYGYGAVTLLTLLLEINDRCQNDVHPYAPEWHPDFIDQARTHRENNDRLCMLLGELASYICMHSNCS